jgi:lipopolysaccharide/colanic/teichoic acid biosynthesis glycosyltransferase
MKRAQAVIKRVLDIAVSATAILLLAPLLIALGLLIALVDKPPVLYHEARCGRGQRAFTLYKFRTLKQAPCGAAVATADDSRLTRTGRFLRRCHLDELPQLFNILGGDMSLVGPRPMKPEHAQALNPPDAEAIARVRPGLTGPDAIAFLAEDEALRGYPDPDSLYISRVLPAKVALMLDYVDNPSLLTDCAILLKTAGVIFTPAAYLASRDRIRALLH